MLTIGLTGGIGSGKSAVTERFRALDVPVIDADEVAREVVAPGRPALARVVERFGAPILRNDGALDRRALRRLIFADPAARADLEAILHPAIRARTRELIAASDAPYLICAIPLLIETGQTDDFDRLLVIDCPRELQLKRITARDRITAAEAEAILAAQIGRDARLAVADDVIDNAGPVEALSPQIEALHRHYLQLAGNDPAPRPNETTAGPGGTPPALP